jgi:hypothetical protein
LTKKEFDSFFIGYPFKSCDSCAKEPQSAICDHGSLKRVCYICELQEEIASLREENERLRNQVIVWHKWPEEVPKTNGWRIVRFNITGARYWDKAYFNSPNHWEHDGRYYDPHMWAEMPEGE